MHSIAALYADQALRLANERADDLRRQAALDRIHAARPGRSILRALAATLTRVRTAFASTEAERPATLPKLADYPHRG